jgi:hypothetical protein
VRLYLLEGDLGTSHRTRPYNALGTALGPARGCPGEDQVTWLRRRAPPPRPAQGLISLPIPSLARQHAHTVDTLHPKSCAWPAETTMQPSLGLSMPSALQVCENHSPKRYVKPFTFQSIPSATSHANGWQLSRPLFQP